MTTPETPPSPGRARLVAIVVLVLVIGTAGAVVGPRLLNETRHVEPTLGVGQVCYEVLDARDVTRSGDIRLTARAVGRSDLDVREPIPANATGEAVMLLVLDSVTDAGWGEKPGVQRAGNCIALGSVTEVGGDPGTTGVGMSLGLAAEGAATIAVGIGLVNVDPAAPLPGLRIHLVALGGSEQAAPTHADLETDVTAGETLRFLRERLDAEGWSVRAGKDGTLVIRALPDGSAVQSVMLSVSYVEKPDVPRPEAVRWTLSVVP